MHLSFCVALVTGICVDGVQVMFTYRKEKAEMLETLVISCQKPSALLSSRRCTRLFIVLSETRLKRSSHIPKQVHLGQLLNVVGHCLSKPQTISSHSFSIRVRDVCKSTILINHAAIPKYNNHSLNQKLIYLSSNLILLYIYCLL